MKISKNQRSGREPPHKKKRRLTDVRIQVPAKSRGCWSEEKARPCSGEKGMPAYSGIDNCRSESNYFQERRTAKKAPRYPQKAQTQQLIVNAQPLEDVQADAVPHHPVSGFGCSCKNSMCLRLYCPCFKGRQVCADSCRCQNCFNVEKNQNVISLLVKDLLSKNPSAFDQRVVKTSQKNVEFCSHGCHCKRTKCVKKYCECYRANVPCTQLCKCVSCSNAQVKLKEGDKVGLANRKKPVVNKKGILPTLLEKFLDAKTKECNFKFDQLSLQFDTN